jgi:cobalt-zinc-cadmium efflux system outer membrane protein
VRLGSGAAALACLTCLTSVTITLSAGAQGPLLTREAAVASAIERGGRLRLAIADTATAFAQWRVARTFENPILTAEYSKSAPQYHLTVDIPFDYPWLRGTRIAAAEATRTATRYRYAFERAAAALDADTTYTRALAAQEKLRLSRRNAIDADSLRRIAIARRDAGDASDLDVELATVSAGQQANTAAADSLTWISTLLDLQTVIGRSATEPTVVLTDSLAAPADSIVARNGQPLPIAAAEAALQSASLAVRLQRRSLFAATSLTAGFETRDPSGDETGILPVIGFSIPFPIFNRNSAQIAVAEAEQFRAQAERDVAVLETRATIARTERQRAIALANVARDRTLVASANRVAALSLTAYREGAAPLATAIEAQRNAREILAQYIDDLAVAWIATAALRVRTLTAETSP